MFSPENLAYYRQPTKANFEENITTPKDFSDKLEAIIHLMESKYTEDLTDRHCDAIQKLIDEMITNNFAFYYKDLLALSKLITIMFHRVKLGKDELITSINMLILLCNKPFVREKSSDELKCIKNTVSLLNSICEILDNDNSKNDELKLLFIETLKFLNDFAEFGIDEYKNQESDFKLKKLYGINFSLLNTLQIEGTRNLRLISDSKILESLVYIITRRLYEDEFMIIVINTILNCAQYKVNAEKLANLGILKDLVQIISETVDFKSLKIRVCIEAIWNILENGGKIACAMMAFEEIVNSLFSTFINVIKNKNGIEDRNTRNDICILINYVVSSPESHLYFIYKDSDSNSNNISFLEILLKYATHDETISILQELDLDNSDELSSLKQNSSKAFDQDVKKKNTLNPKLFFLTTSPEDVEFKKIIWTTILYIIKDNHYKPEVIECLEKYKFLSCLLLYLDPEALKLSCISRWQQPQLKDIHILCMNILLNIIPLYQEYFEKIKGYTTLIKFLQLYHDKERRLACLKTINNVINSPNIKNELTEESKFYCFIY